MAGVTSTFAGTTRCGNIPQADPDVEVFRAMHSAVRYVDRVPPFRTQNSRSGGRHPLVQEDPFHATRSKL